MAQIINITSEALQQTIRRLLPSQQGFGEDLQASNVILPIIDLTPSGEGSELRSDLQTSWDFATSHYNLTTSSNQLVDTPGFFQVDLTVSLNFGLSSSSAIVFISDGTSNKTIWRASHASAQGNDSNSLLENKFVVFLRAGDTLNGGVSNSGNPMDIWLRQIADVNGNLTEPLGFVQQ